MKQMIHYMPANKAAPPSMLQQRALSENQPLPGPDADPAGWKVSPPINLEGKLSGNEVKAIYKVSYLTLVF